MGRPTLGETLAAADFRTGHRPSRRGDRDRQTWPRTDDQATAGRTPQRTEDPCGHTTGQARATTEPRWQARQFRPTATHTMRTGPPENTRQPRPTPFGPQPSNTHCCSLTRNGSPVVSSLQPWGNTRFLTPSPAATTGTSREPDEPRNQRRRTDRQRADGHTLSLDRNHLFGLIATTQPPDLSTRRISDSARSSSATCSRTLVS